MSNKKGEITTIITIGVILLGIVLTAVTSWQLNKGKNIASTPKAANSSGIVCSGSSNYTCSEICGSYSNYVPNSQKVKGAIRKCICKNISSCKVASIPSSLPTSTIAQNCFSNFKTNEVCVGESYILCSDCEKICGIGQCQSCKFGSTTKWQCYRMDPKSGATLKRCSKPRTYSNEENCKKEGCNKCTQCTLQGAVRYECGSSGPRQCQPNEIVCGNNCCSNNQKCINNNCVTPTRTPKLRHQYPDPY